MELLFGVCQVVLCICQIIRQWILAIMLINFELISNMATCDNIILQILRCKKDTNNKTDTDTRNTKDTKNKNFKSSAKLDLHMNFVLTLN